MQGDSTVWQEGSDSALCVAAVAMFVARFKDHLVLVAFLPCLAIRPEGVLRMRCDMMCHCSSRQPGQEMRQHTVYSRHLTFVPVYGGNEAEMPWSKWALAKMHRSACCMKGCERGMKMHSLKRM